MTYLGPREAWLRRWLHPGAAFKRALSTRLQRAALRVGTECPPSRTTYRPAASGFSFAGAGGRVPAAVGLFLCRDRGWIWVSCLQIAYKQQKRKNPTTKLIAGFPLFTWGG